jgi:hypothetical protein
VTPDDLRPEERRSLADLLHARGRDPASFTVALQADGLVRVSGPRGTAFYPHAQWFSRFSRHLDKSFFDPEVPAPAGPRLERKASAAGVGGGG